MNDVIGTEKHFLDGPSLLISLGKAKLGHRGNELSLSLSLFLSTHLLSQRKQSKGAKVMAFKQLSNIIRRNILVLRSNFNEEVKPDAASTSLHQSLNKEA